MFPHNYFTDSYFYSHYWPAVALQGAAVGKRAQIVGVSAGRQSVRGVSARRLEVAGDDTGRNNFKGNV